VVACVPVAAGTRQAVVARTVTSAADGAAHDEGSLVVRAARVILRPPAGAASAVRARRAQSERRQVHRGSAVRNVRNVASWPHHPVGPLVRLVQQEAAATQLVHRLAVALRLHALVLAVVVWQVRAGDRVRLRAASRQLRAPRCSVRAQHRELGLFAPIAVDVRVVAVIAGTSAAARGVGVARAACLELAVQHLVVISAVLAVNGGGGQEFSPSPAGWSSANTKRLPPALGMVPAAGMAPAAPHSETSAATTCAAFMFCGAARPTRGSVRVAASVAHRVGTGVKTAGGTITLASRGAARICSAANELAVCTVCAAAGWSRVDRGGLAGRG
jgi:hypothetical protein